MKRVCIFAFIVLAAALKVNAQIDETAVRNTLAKEGLEKIGINLGGKNKNKASASQPQDTVNETVAHRRKRTVGRCDIQDSKTGTGRRTEQKSKADDDCKQIKSQLAPEKENNRSLQKSNDSLRKTVEDLEAKLVRYKTVFDIDDGRFYRSLFLKPLSEKYDSIQVDHYKKIVEIFDHKNKEKMKRQYDLFYPLLENYGKYNDEVAKLINREIYSFILLDTTPDIKSDRESFERDLNDTEYFKEYRYKDNIGQEIKYLEDVIEETRALFDDPKKFKKENFEEQLGKLCKMISK